MNERNCFYSSKNQQMHACKDIQVYIIIIIIIIIIIHQHVSAPFLWPLSGRRIKRTE
jgi:hypothetical protein